MGRIAGWDKQDFINSVYEIVASIPPGKVLSYGAIATLAAHPGYHRMVGRILHEVSPELKLPCHRVVSSQGRLVPGWATQLRMLLVEGVTFTRSGRVDMGKHDWFSILMNISDGGI